MDVVQIGLIHPGKDWRSHERIPAGTQVWAIKHNGHKTHYFRYAYTHKESAAIVADKLQANWDSMLSHEKTQELHSNYLSSADFIIASSVKPNEIYQG